MLPARLCSTTQPGKFLSCFAQDARVEHGREEGGNPDGVLLNRVLFRLGILYTYRFWFRSEGVEFMRLLAPFVSLLTLGCFISLAQTAQHQKAQDRDADKKEAVAAAAKK